MGNPFAAPAIAAERTGKTALEDRRKHAQREFPDGLQRFPEYGGCAEEVGVCARHVRSKIGLVAEDQVVAVHFNLTGGFRAPGDFLGKLFRVPVCADVRHDDQLFVSLFRSCAPLIIPGEHFIELAVEHRTVAAADGLHIQLLHTIEGGAHIGAAERSDDTVEIVFGCFPVLLFIRYAGAEHVLAGIMRSE